MSAASLHSEASWTVNDPPHDDHKMIWPVENDLSTPSTSDTSFVCSLPTKAAISKIAGTMRRMFSRIGKMANKENEIPQRQEYLSSLLYDVLVTKNDSCADDQEPSSNWIDQLEKGRDQLHTDKERSPDVTAPLSVKYGKCRGVIGRGTFAVIRLSQKVDPKCSRAEKLYAIKEIRCRSQEPSKAHQRRLRSEFCISSSLRHANIVSVFDLLQNSKGNFCEVMEYCAGGDLYSLILTAGILGMVEADCYFKQLISGVKYMHEMGVAHRDLKLENLLLTAQGVLKIASFGNSECFRLPWEKEAHMTSGICSSAPYIAPEEYVHSEFDPRAVDVWATGIIYMAMRSGRFLWRLARKGKDESYERYLEDRREEHGYPPIENLHGVGIFYAMDLLTTLS